MFEKAFKDLAAGFSLFHVWFYQAYHLLVAKYKRTVFGSLWVGGSMVATSLSLAIVFGGLFGENLAEALPYIMGGILCFSLIGYIFAESPEVFVSNSGIIGNHAYPFTYYVFEGVSKSLFLFLHNLVIFQIGIICVGAWRMPHPLIIAGLSLVVVSMFTWGTVIGMISSRYRDVRFLLPYVSQLLFFISPVFYRPERLSGARRVFADANPIYAMLEVVRAPLLGTVPSLHIWTMAAGFTLAGVVLWLIVFPPFRKQIPFWVH